MRTPWISERQRNKALERIFAQPHYATIEQIEIEEQERTQRVRALLPNVPSGSETPTIRTLPAPEKPPKIKRPFPPESMNNTQTPWDTFDNLGTHEKTDSENEK